MKVCKFIRLGIINVNFFKFMNLDEKKVDCRGRIMENTSYDKFTPLVL
jgi:hypothetical protein